jgi:hypothetical protein
MSGNVSISRNTLYIRKLIFICGAGVYIHIKIKMSGYISGKYIDPLPQTLQTLDFTGDSASQNFQARIKVSERLCYNDNFKELNYA